MKVAQTSWSTYKSSTLDESHYVLSQCRICHFAMSNTYSRYAVFHRWNSPEDRGLTAWRPRSFKWTTLVIHPTRLVPHAFLTREKTICTAVQWRLHCTPLAFAPHCSKRYDKKLRCVTVWQCDSSKVNLFQYEKYFYILNIELIFDFHNICFRTVTL